MATATTSLERPLPHNVEAERSILGRDFYADNNAINAAIEKLKPEDFSHDHHRRIYQQMIALEGIAAGDRPHHPHRTIAAHPGELESVGGAAYVSPIDGRRTARYEPRALRAHRQRKSAPARPDPCDERDPAAGPRSGGDDADAILDRAESSIFQLAEDQVPRTWRTARCGH